MISIRLPHLRGHARALSQLDAYLDDELAPIDRLQFERHLAGCESCQAALADAREVKALLAALPPIAAPRSFQLTAVALEDFDAAPPPRRHPAMLRLLQAATAVAIIAFVSLMTLDLTGVGSTTASLTSGPRAESVAAPSHDALADPPATAAAAATSATTTAVAVPGMPAVVPPTDTGVHAQGVAPDASPSPLPSAIASATEEAPTPPPSPTASGQFGAFDAPSGAGSAPPPDGQREFYSTYRGASVTAGWYRPAEIALAGIALVGLALTLLFAIRVRR